MTAAADIRPDAPRRVRLSLSTSAWLLLVTLIVVGFGFVASRSAPVPDQGPPQGGVADAQRAVEALVSPGAEPTALALLPADLNQVLGVTAAAEPARDGTVRAVHVGGGCSAPWGEDSTRWDFGVACMSHDLGYDLLRYAENQGHPLDPKWREALDARLSADMQATCDLNPMDSAGTCKAVASLYTAGLVVNSWHQRWGPPTGEPIGPMLAGVAVIGCLLVFRLRGWLRARRAVPKATGATALPAAIPPVLPCGRWMVLAVAAIAGLVLGESATALGHWAGVPDGWLWPLTWLTQLAPVFFFAGGHANAAGWRACVDNGGGYRQYLAHRASWLLRPALIFVLVAFAVPTALELLHIPAGTTAVVTRIALHPLWLLGFYLLTVVLTPAMSALQRRLRSGWPVVVALAAAVVTAELIGSPIARYAGGFALALLAQQVAFVHAAGGTPKRLPLVAGAAGGLGALVLTTTTGGVAPMLLNVSAAPPALAAPTLPVLLLGVAQLCLLGLLGTPLARLAAREDVARAAAQALRAPMSLYLGFLATMLLLVTVVYLPVNVIDAWAWLTHPRTVAALGLLAGPAVLVFWWFERRAHNHSPHPPVAPVADGGLGRLLGRSAVVLGLGFAVMGLFGFALTQFGGQFGLVPDPIQNLVHLLLGVFLLHTQRIGTSDAPATWVLTALACVPPLLSATAGPVIDRLGVALHGVVAVLAVIAVIGTLLTRLFAPPEVARATS
ncbi:phospholipase [Amycolatopsis sp. 195334CR]|uniref:phospholipase n=1 Tax=Amycolatopsis sp. 195334CR TaxID=2814588 RepID=UPI001A8C169F|nr:phospholipase [Amycolatopsis sp. 195334CR]MBN6033953.1 phospholipase [Amycolatopsis sp. 195334CR]